MSMSMPVQSVEAVGPRRYYDLDIYCEDERFSLRRVGTNVLVVNLSSAYRVTYDDVRDVLDTRAVF
eukprot:6379200-Lingulodinium_polyedra.AAC.1